MQTGYYVINETNVTWFPLSNQTPSHRLPGKIFTFMNLAQSENAIIKKKLKPYHQLPNFIKSQQLTIGESILLEEIPTKNNNMNQTVFPLLRIQNHPYFTFMQGIKKIPDSIATFSQINIVSGCCLYGLHSVYAINENGNKVYILSQHETEENTPFIRFQDEPFPSFYEMESIVRLTQFIADFVSVLPTHISIQLIFDIPRVQYYLNLIGLLEKERISFPLFQQWINLVDERYHNVKKTIRSTMFALLKFKKIDPIPTITFTDGLNSIRKLIVDAIESREIPALAMLINHLCMQHEWWQAVCQVSPPSSYHMLSNMSYSIELLQYGLQKKNPTTYLFEVDNPSERKIYRLAKRYAQKLKYHFPASSFYPLEMIFNNNGHTNLYFQQIPTKIMDHTKNVISPFDLLQKLYPSTYKLVCQSIDDQSSLLP